MIDSLEFHLRAAGLHRGVNADDRAISASMWGVTILSLCIFGLACTQPPRPPAGEANAGIDSLNARLVRAYRARDPVAYAALYTDTAVFEWPAQILNASG